MAQAEHNHLVCPICKYPQANLSDRCSECGALLKLRLATDEQLEPYPVRSIVLLVLVGFALLSTVVMAGEALYQQGRVEVHEVQLRRFDVWYKKYLVNLDLWKTQGGRTSGWPLPDPPSLSEALALPVPEIGVRLLWRTAPVVFMGSAVVLICIRFVLMLVYRRRPASVRARSVYQTTLLLIALTGAIGIGQLFLVAML